MSEELYKQNILDHTRNPQNKGVIHSYTHHAEGKNPSCGDSLVLYVRVDNDVIKDVSFEGEGCAISTAAASMLTQKIKGMKISDARLLAPGDVYSMLGITISPGRSKCALLAYGTFSSILNHIKK